MKKINMRKLYFLLIITIFLVLNGCKQGGDTPVDPPVSVTGTKILTKTVGSNLSDLTTGVVQADDGSILFCGFTISSAFGDNDMFVVKMDGAGNVLWSNLYGGSGNDQALSIDKTFDGGFIIGGTSNSFTGNFTAVAIKIDASGNVVWSKYYAGGNQDYGTKLIRTNDYGYIMTGYTNSFGAGENDMYSLKLDQDGGIMFQRVYGNTVNDFANTITETDDDGFILGGYSFSFGSSGEAIITKIYGDGIIEWSKTYGGAGLDNITDIRVISNGFVACGSTNSFGLTTDDALVFNIDDNGFVYWARTFGGNAGGTDAFSKLQVNSDGSITLAGFTVENPSNLADISLTKLFGDGAFQWQKTFGSTGNDAGISLFVKSDFGYLLAGNMESATTSNDSYILSLKSDGTGCSPDNPVTPLGGTPTLDIIEPEMFDNAATFTMNNASVQKTGFGVNQNTVCVQDP